MAAVVELAPRVGVHAACLGLGVPRATFYRWRPLSAATAAADRPPLSRPRPVRALSEQEQQHVLSFLHSERFQNSAPAAIHAQFAR